MKMNPRQNFSGNYNRESWEIYDGLWIIADHMHYTVHVCAKKSANAKDNISSLWKGKAGSSLSVGAMVAVTWTQGMKRPFHWYQAIDIR